MNEKLSQSQFAEAVQALPHGPEFRFIDRLLTLQPGRHGSAEYTVPTQAPFLQGHFPGNPIFPGVLMIEAIAQMAGIVAQSTETTAVPRRLKLTAVRAVKIFGTVGPAQTLHVHATMTARLGALIHAQGRIFQAEKTLCVAEISLSTELTQSP